MINGIINVRKEAGFSSHDVVARLRGILHQKKIGHTGTLDPDAVGVLPVCLGKATRLCDMIADWTKTYEGVLLLGITTDTEDLSGKVLSETPVSVSEEDILSILKSFEGEYDQIPPMYSAKKIKGRKLYELAREGITIERDPCRVHIFSIDPIEISLPRVRFRVVCSKGTYIRSLCRDAGEKAGCGGCMESLVRTHVSDFHIEDSLTLAEIEAAAEDGRLMDIVRPIDSVFTDYPCVTAKEGQLKRLYNGNPVPAGQEVLQSYKMSMEKGRLRDILRVYDPDGSFIGLYRVDPRRNRLDPYKLFFDKQV